MWRRLLLILVLVVTVPALALVLVAHHSWHSETPLLQAVRYGHPTWTWLLLVAGADANARARPWEHSPLHEAAYDGRLEVARLLLDHGADPNAVHVGNPDLPYMLPGTTALYMALYLRHADVAGLLIARGAKHTLHTAAGMGDIAALTELLDAGGAVDARSPLQETPLMFAAMYDRANAVRLLLDRGADIEADDHYGRTALCWAAGWGGLTTTTLLLDRGARLQGRHPGEGSARHEAAQHGTAEMVALLLARGAKVDGTDDSGETPLLRALEPTPGKDCTSIVRLLLEHGADVNARDRFGQTALERAELLTRTDPAVIALLREHGARR